MAMAMASSPTELHAVVIPFPLQGHINCFLPLANVLASHGFVVTFLIAQHTYDRSGGNQPEAGKRNRLPTGIHLVGVPDGLPPDFPRDDIGKRGPFHVLSGMRAGVEELLFKLGNDGELPVTCVIADTFVTWSHDVCSKFGIPRVAFYTASAHACALSHFAHLLVSKGLLPFKGNGRDYDPDFVIDCIPGVPPLHPMDFPRSLRFMHQFAIEQFEHIRQTEGIIFNTFYEMESNTIDAIRKDVPVYPIGFLLLHSKEDLMGSSALINYWPEDDNCLAWLTSQPASSVLYVSFGSMGVLPAEQIKELAEGLENSEQRFLWVIRPNSLQGSLSDNLPEGFVDRTKSRGLIISWAPQLQVLSHPSVGGFLTHSGWNSITENLCTGAVPMLCWPLGAEQRLNCRLLVDKWQIGMEFRKREDEGVEKEEVERAVRALMQAEGTRRRVSELKERASRAVGEGGSSQTHLRAFVEKMLQQQQHNKKIMAEPQ
eukprot:c27592_g1_i1 orf=107-1561(+)